MQTTGEMIVGEFLTGSIRKDFVEEEAIERNIEKFL